MNSQDLKDQGMAVAAENRKELLKEAREIAVAIAQEKGTVTADDVAARLGNRKLGPAAGSIFKDKRFEFTGRRVRSQQLANHARELKVWMLADASR